nr:MAG TPA: hypothetical protein [Caudoviricetes sp.]
MSASFPAAHCEADRTLQRMLPHLSAHCSNGARSNVSAGTISMRRLTLEPLPGSVSYTPRLQCDSPGYIRAAQKIGDTIAVELEFYFRHLFAHLVFVGANLHDRPLRVGGRAPFDAVFYAVYNKMILGGHVDCGVPPIKGGGHGDGHCPSTDRLSRRGRRKHRGRQSNVLPLPWHGITILIL